MIGNGIGIEHVIARQRAETTQIALNASSSLLAGHNAMRQQSGLAPQTKVDVIVDGETTTRISKLGDDLDFVLA